MDSRLLITQSRPPVLSNGGLFILLTDVTQCRCFFHPLTQFKIEASASDATEEDIDLYLGYAWSWGIGMAIGWAISGFLIGWQLLNTKDKQEE